MATGTEYQANSQLNGGSLHFRNEFIIMLNRMKLQLPFSISLSHSVSLSLFLSYFPIFPHKYRYRYSYSYMLAKAQFILFDLQPGTLHVLAPIVWPPDNAHIPIVESL